MVQDFEDIAYDLETGAVDVRHPELALAGLRENWRSPAGEWLRSFAIITTEPNELCAELHNRMPVLLKPESSPVWLGGNLPARPS